MEKQETNKKTSNFENLITLKNILKSNELNAIVANISKSKNMLNNFCKNLKNHEQELRKNANAQKVVEEKVVVEKVENKSATIVDKSAIVQEKHKTFDIDKKKEFNKSKENVVFNKVQQKENGSSL